MPRASASFNDLVQFHKELKAKQSDRKHKKHRHSNISDETSKRLSKIHKKLQKRVSKSGYRGKRRENENPINVEQRTHMS
ncbi:unnamed protein product [Ilex paraguariensis]|uniref:Uncharacterized protein n=1 Tax=Ilex paraguariensis TaxID=185542 RepID=A0ABC8TDQ1_9AQUA